MAHTPCRACMTTTAITKIDEREVEMIVRGVCRALTTA